VKQVEPSRAKGNVMADKKPIRVIIVDDQAIVRSGLAAFLMAFDELHLVGEATDGEEAVQLCEMVHPDIVLMDLKMPRMDGISATHTIQQRWPDIKILVLTSFREKEMVQGALDAGAAGYLLKDITSKELAQAIFQVYQGQQMVVKEATRTLQQAELLKKLAAALQNVSDNQSALPELLEKHLPEIFPDCQLLIRIFPKRKLLAYPAQPQFTIPETAWDWLRKAAVAKLFFEGNEYPWGGKHEAGSTLILAPIKANDLEQPSGGICILHRTEIEDPTGYVQTVQALAAHIAYAVDKNQDQELRLSQQKVSQELLSAGRIQASILPEKPPVLRGWDIAALLEPARETSGDFYDFIPLANGKWGFLIADVTDKGMGAALFMALSSTLIRTYATQYPTLPALALNYINRRLLSDTHGAMFITAFYGVLDPENGRLRYVNAGHNPPFLLSSQKGKPVDQLRGTGMALGVMEDASWQQKIARFSPGDILLLYTDGITEAENMHREFYGEQRILEVLRSHRDRAAHAIQDALLEDVRKFTNKAPKTDDIAIMVIAREKD
jgi:serine phosphatase RsbU (regulator of sigma subunit)/DNA-binding NarL/FixJ family response regulator